MCRQNHRYDYEGYDSEWLCINSHYLGFLDVHVNLSIMVLFAFLTHWNSTTVARNPTGNLFWINNAWMQWCTGVAWSFLIASLHTWLFISWCQWLVLPQFVQIVCSTSEPFHCFQAYLPRQELFLWPFPSNPEVPVQRPPIACKNHDDSTAMQWLGNHNSVPIDPQ